MQNPALVRSARRSRRGFRALAGSITPARATQRLPIPRDKPLSEQHQRIGGGLTPADVTWIMQLADAGQPERLCDLFHESRQKDGHLHSTCETREMGVKLCQLEFVAPEDATEKELEAAKLCRLVVRSFKHWPELITHLTRSFLYGHATAVTKPYVERDGYLIPVEASRIQPREFIFRESDGTLRYRTRPGDLEGLDLLEKYPGRVIQLQRTIMGDAPMREGLYRLLIWFALFRNWDLRDWMALAEIGWKPWRLLHYKGTHNQDVDNAIAQLERMAATGIGAFPAAADVRIEWPKASGGSSQRSTHLEFFDTSGREISKATLGQTTSVESGPNGTRSDTQTRDELRKDRREDDALSVAAALAYCLFWPVIRFNLGEGFRYPVPAFQTEDAPDRKTFAEALEKLTNAGVPIPVDWVRNETGMPKPDEGDEILPVQLHTSGGRKYASEEEIARIEAEAKAQAEQAAQAQAQAAQQTQPAGGKPAPKQPAKPAKKAAENDPQADGPEYTDRLVDEGRKAAADALSAFVGDMVGLIQEVDADPGLDDQVKKVRLLALIQERYREAPPPVDLGTAMAATFEMANLGGRQAVRVEDGGLEPDEE